MTSVLKKGPRATSAEPAETSQRSETSGASCRTSQEPAFRVTSARRSEPVIRGGAREASARRESQTLGVRPVRAEEREGIRGRLRAAGQIYEEVAFSGIKGGGTFRILQSRRSEHPNGGNCMARHRARTHSGTSNARRALRLCADLRRIHTGRERCIRDTDAGDGRCVLGRD